MGVEDVPMIFVRSLLHFGHAGGGRNVGRSTTVTDGFAKYVPQGFSGKTPPCPRPPRSKMVFRAQL